MNFAMSPVVTGDGAGHFNGFWAVGSSPVSAPVAASLATCRILADARRLLVASSYFRHRADSFELEVVDAVLIVRGRVPSFHLKQLLQKILANLNGVARIDNRVHVVSSAGLSSAG